MKVFATSVEQRAGDGKSHSACSEFVTNVTKYAFTPILQAKSLPRGNNQTPSRSAIVHDNAVVGIWKLHSIRRPLGIELHTQECLLLRLIRLVILYLSGTASVWKLRPSSAGVA